MRGKRAKWIRKHLIETGGLGEHPLFGTIYRRVKKEWTKMSPADRETFKKHPQLFIPGAR